jgi:hypothetical protein
MIDHPPTGYAAHPTSDRPDGPAPSSSSASSPTSALRVSKITKQELLDDREAVRGEKIFNSGEA